jgi:transcription initiation factor IIE alpha subunit
MMAKRNNGIHPGDEAMVYEGKCPNCGARLRARPYHPLFSLDIPPLSALNGLWKQFDRLMYQFDRLMRKTLH